MHHNPYPPSRPRAPLALVLIIALIGLIIIAAIIGWVIWQWYALEATAPTLALAIRAAMFILPLAGAIEAGAIVWRRWASAELLKADRVVKLTQAQQQRFP